MKLNDISLQNPQPWIEQGFRLPKYDRAAVRERTRKSPVWVHLGAGNIFRAFLCALQDDLLDKNLFDTGIIAAEGFDEELIEKAYLPFDSLSVLAVLKSSGSVEKRVLGSVMCALNIAAGQGPDWEKLKEIFSSPTLQMASFTITEKGYAFAADSSLMGKTAALCLHRYQSGAYPLALVSMDNCSHNGERLRSAILQIANRWIAEGKAEAGFLQYLEDESKVSFPWTMIDKITPRPDESVQAMLKSTGFEDTDVIVTSKRTYTAAFVNAEEAQYLVVEDRFPNGRPPLHMAGVLFAGRDTVNLTEKMKVGTCLNPLHTALAVLGCLLGYTSIHAEMKDDDLKRLVHHLGHAEGMPVVADPKIIKPSNFLNEVLSIRFPNPFLPDTPQRIATDTSQKLPIRFGETLKAYEQRPDLDITSLTAIPLVYAAWLRYLMGIGDDGKPFDLSPDPLLSKLQPVLGKVALGDRGPFHELLFPIVSDASLFGVNLYEAGLGDKVEGFFAQMVTSPGAVRKLMHETVCTFQY
jgi:fructuronate reductase